MCLLLFSVGEASEEEVKERQARAMADPEVQNILMDPVMRQVCVVLCCVGVSNTLYDWGRQNTHTHVHVHLHTHARMLCHNC